MPVSAKSGLRGKFVTFEGGEGSGKSSLLARLKTDLDEKGIPFVYSAEPGGSIIGEEIRQILLAHRDGKFSAKCEALLYAAGRAQHVEELIGPALAGGKNVLLDRYLDASLAYQGVGRGLGVDQIRQVNEWATGGLTPNRTYFFDVDPQVGLARAKGRNALDRFEKENIEFHQKIRATYRELAQADPNRYLIVDASASANEVFRIVREDLLGWLKRG